MMGINLENRPGIPAQFGWEQETMGGGMGERGRGVIINTPDVNLQ